MKYEQTTLRTNKLMLDAMRRIAKTYGRSLNSELALAAEAWRGGRYVVAFRDAEGKQRWESARTLDDARTLKATREADVSRGEFHAESRITLHDYAAEWVERYQGSGRGFRESTRTDYRRHLKVHVYRYFSPKKRLAQVTPRDVSNFIGWLCDEKASGRKVSDKTVRNVVGTLRTCLATAVCEGLIRHNPAHGSALPHRPAADGSDGEAVKSFSRKELADTLGNLTPADRLMFEFLAGTGLRWSELIGLRWQDLELDGDDSHVQVRRAYVRGQFSAPKSRYGRRDIPLDGAMAARLRRERMANGWPADDALVFRSEAGTPLDHSNTLRRVLRPAAEAAGVPWAGFHTFRHTCASLLFESGRNAVQVQRWLGHHSASFTLDTYIHLLPGEAAEPLKLSDELRGANKVQTEGTQTDPNGEGAQAEDSAQESEISEPTQLHRSA